MVVAHISERRLVMVDRVLEFPGKDWIEYIVSNKAFHSSLEETKFHVKVVTYSQCLEPTQPAPQCTRYTPKVAVYARS